MAGLIYTVEERVCILTTINVQYIVTVCKFFQIKSYPTNHLLMIMGNDFVFKDAALWFDSVDRIIEYGNILVQT